MHSALLVSWRRRTVLIDCGADWAGLPGRLHPDAIVLTHAHPDHAGGLKSGAPCRVFATGETWSRVRLGPVGGRETIQPRSPVVIHGIEFEAFPVEHSIRAPAVGFRIGAGRKYVFYAPDLVRIYRQREALAGIRLYIGDGASILRPILRKRGDAAIGHASIRMQLDWCAAEGVPRAIFTHCGSGTVRGEPRSDDVVRALGAERGVDASLAYDGMRLTV